MVISCLENGCRSGDITVCSVICLHLSQWVLLSMGKSIKPWLYADHLLFSANNVSREVLTWQREDILLTAWPKYLNYSRNLSRERQKEVFKIETIFRNVSRLTHLLSLANNNHGTRSENFSDESKIRSITLHCNTMTYSMLSSICKYSTYCALYGSVWMLAKDSSNISYRGERADLCVF